MGNASKARFATLQPCKKVRLISGAPMSFPFDLTQENEAGITWVDVMEASEDGDGRWWYEGQQLKFACALLCGATSLNKALGGIRA